MSATYNWAYRPNVPNKYGIQIPDTTDDVRPDGYCYIALFGNDSTGNGSRLYPFKTLYNASQLYPGSNMIIGSGVYREIFIGAGYYFGDGDVTIDGFPYVSFSDFNCHNISFRNMQQSFRFDIIQDSTIVGDGLVNQDCYQNGAPCNFNVFKNISTMDYRNGGPISNQSGFNTFININNVNISTVANGSGLSSFGNLWFSIYDNCNITFMTNINLDYCLFHNCSFRWESGDYTPINDIPSLITFVQSVVPNNQSFINSIIADPLFNNPSIGDYTLNINSPAKNASYTGSFIGAHSIATPIKASATASFTGFDSLSNINLSITEDSITLVDTTQDAQIDTIVIPNMVQREISKFPSYGFMADRNGQYIDSIPDLSGTSSNPGDILGYPSSYLVSNGSINYNSNIYQPGDRFTTATSSTIFTTTANGVVFEILEAPQRHTIMARFSNGDSTPLDNTDTLVINNWYYVSSGTILHNTISYSSGDVFKSTDTSFSGSGIVTLAMSDEIYQHYEPGIQPTTNNVGDDRNGEVLRGNGDPNYVRGGLNITEFPINAKYVQVRYMIKVNNLKP